jgi:uncharacterized OB-fold protein
MKPIPYLPGENGGDYYRRSQAIIAAQRKAEWDAQTDRNRKAGNLRRRLAEGAGRYVFGVRPRCDECGSPELKAYRTDTAGETIARHVECKACGAKFVLVLE